MKLVSKQFFFITKNDLKVSKLFNISEFAESLKCEEAVLRNLIIHEKIRRSSFQALPTLDIAQL